MRVSVSVLRKLVGAVVVVVGIVVVGCGWKVNTGTFTDTRDGQTYRTVVMPDRKMWMAENLNHQADSSWCYDNDTSNCDKYGRLYTWDASMKACPEGWRLPSDEEWSALTDAVGGWKTAGTKLKSKTEWTEDDRYIPGTDEYGFSALPGGYRYSDGSFDIAGYYGGWWTATERDRSYAWRRDMYYDGEGVRLYGNDKSNALSVRCLRD